MPALACSAELVTASGRQEGIILLTKGKLGGRGGRLRVGTETRLFIPPDWRNCKRRSRANCRCRVPRVERVEQDGTSTLPGPDLRPARFHPDCGCRK